ncbi:hypothetical protein DID75_03020 [Candidatus Marinamargulisbacteria bacterium SCGC AG-410-N11]|nr:hypothetical protein DID75_03020 [Candidatus Marinamargulisbacteria bacterium SCGC AG-410-N11]
MLNSLSFSSHFSGIDWLIVFIYLSISLLIGLKARTYIKSVTDYMGAGRAVGPWLGIASMAGTEMGLITIMYSAQKGFTGGFASFHIALAAIIVTLFVGFSGFIVVPLRQLKVLTIPEFYLKRYGRRTQLLGGVLLAVGGILNMGLFLKVGAMFMVAITGLDPSGSTITWVMIGLLMLVLLYTMLGGMISVVITDYIQFVLLSIGLLIVTMLSLRLFGWQSLIVDVQTILGESGFNPFASTGTFGWSYVLWMIFTAGLVSCAIWPTAVQRALIIKTPEDVKTQYKWSAVTFMIRFLIPNFLGICALVYCWRSDIWNTVFFTDKTMSSLYAFPIFLSELLPVGVLGLVTAALVAAFMSTHDSYLLCWSSVITQDIIGPLRRKALSVSQTIWVTRLCIVLIGLYILYWGLWYQGTEDIWDYLAITGAVYFTGAFTVLVGGLYWKKASSTGAVMALLCGFFALLGLGPIQQMLSLPIVGGDVIGLCTVAVCIVVFVLGSLLFPDRVLKKETV